MLFARYLSGAKSMKTIPLPPITNMNPEERPVRTDENRITRTDEGIFVLDLT